MGGPAHQVSLLSGRRMDPDRFETLLVHGKLAPGEQSLESVAEGEGARTRFLPELAQPVSPASDLQALVKLRSLVRSFRPDVVHTHTAKAGFLGRQAALSAGAAQPALVHTFHGHVLEGYFGPAKERLFRGLETRLGRRTDRLIGVSEATVADLVRLGVAERARFRVIPLGLDLSGFASLGEAERAASRAELGVGEDEVLVSFVGRVVPIKRLHLLLEAVAVARSAGARVRLAVAGDGEIRADLEAQARGLGLGEVVSWLGYRRDLQPLAAAADIAALSSANEGTPVSLIEAAAAGVPAVSTDVGGVAEVVADGKTGILVPSGDAEALSQALVRLAGDAELRARYGAAARESALGRYSIERLLADIQEMYGELVRVPVAAGTA